MFDKLAVAYKGFVIKQVEPNNFWEIVVVPNRDRYGFISPGPYPSIGVAKHRIDIILNQDFPPVE